MFNKLNKKFIFETMRFGLVGVLNTIVGYGVYYILIKFKLYYMIALLTSHIVGVIHSYFWNKYYTFKSRRKSKSELLKFISVYAVTFLVNLGILTFLVEVLGMGREIAGLIALVIVTGLSFLGHKFWSFKNTK